MERKTRGENHGAETCHPLLRHVRIDPRRAGRSGKAAQLACLANGPLEITFRKPLTVIVGENGSGKTTLLEALAARAALPPEGGFSYAETDDDRPETPLSRAVEADWSGFRPPRGLFVRADRLVTMAEEFDARRGRLPFAANPDEWRGLSEQSRGESVLSLLSSHIEASEAMLYFLDEPEAALSPQRQLTLLCLLDQIHRDGRSQVVLATHSPILMAHPEADVLWLDETGIAPRPLEEVDHWRLMRRFMRDPEGYVGRLLADD